MTSDLENKIKNAKKIIQNVYEANDGRLVVSFSGGKDSTVLLHLARSMYPNLKAVFSNTTNESPEILKFVKTIDNLDIVFPTYYNKRVNFLWAIKHYGFPVISKEVSQKVNELKNTKSEKLKNLLIHGNEKGNSKLPKKYHWLAKEKFDVSHKCCALLKKNPLKKYQEKNNVAILVGIMAGESRLRSQLALYGEERIDKSYPFLYSGWTEKNIWEYIEHYNLNIAECYFDRVINGHFIPAKSRTGCEFCAFGIMYEKDKFDNLKLRRPKMYNLVMSVENNGYTYKDVLNKILKKS